MVRPGDHQEPLALRGARLIEGAPFAAVDDPIPLAMDDERRPPKATDLVQVAEAALLVQVEPLRIEPVEPEPRDRAGEAALQDGRGGSNPARRRSPWGKDGLVGRGETSAIRRGRRRRRNRRRPGTHPAGGIEPAGHAPRLLSRC